MAGEGEVGLVRGGKMKGKGGWRGELTVRRPREIVPTNLQRVAVERDMVADSCNVGAF